MQKEFQKDITHQITTTVKAATRVTTSEVLI